MKRPQKPATRAVTTKVSGGLSVRPVTVTAWLKRVRSTAARNATTSPPNGSAAARIAAPGAPSTRSRCWPRSTVRRHAARGRADLARGADQLDRPRQHPAFPHRGQRAGPGARRRPGARRGDAARRRAGRRQVHPAARGRRTAGRRPAGARCTSRRGVGRPGAAAGRPHRLHPRRALPRRRDRPARCSATSSRCGRACWSSTRCRPSSTAEVDGVTGRRHPGREVAAALIRVAKTPRHRERAGRPRHQGRRHRRAAGARAPRRRRAALRGRPHSPLRMVRGVKNRFGPADEVGCFDCCTTTASRASPTRRACSSTSGPSRCPGTCVTVTLEGRRPLLAEVQALVGSPASGSPAPYGQRPRLVPGRDGHSPCSSSAPGFPSAANDVYAVHRRRRAADRARRPTWRSRWRSRPPAPTCPCPPTLVAIGEVGLAGELRRVSGMDRRLAEAARLGFGCAVVPAGVTAGARRGCGALPGRRHSGGVAGARGKSVRLTPDNGRS